MQKIGEKSHNNNKISRIKTYYSIKDQEPNIIKPLIGFVIPRLKRNYSHIIETRKPNKIQKF